MLKVFIIREERHRHAVSVFLDQNWKAQAEKGKPLVIEIKPERSKRSVMANRYHWQMMQQIAEQAWLNGRQYDAETWHYFFCGEFIGKTEMPLGGFRPMGSSDLTVEEFAAFDRKIEAFAAQELGVTILERDFQ